MDCCRRASEKLAFAALVAIVAPGGALVGAVTGAFKGHTTETGLLHGVVMGAVAGTVVSIDLLESSLRGQTCTLVSAARSLINGKAFGDLVSPAMLKAYEWQAAAVEFTPPLAKATPMKPLPTFKLRSVSAHSHEAETCPICLQDFEDGEAASRLPSCGHIYHSACVDKWLTKQNSCPICRGEV
ncbi:RING/U-box superfamily protein [Wolffia australiana]